MTNRRHQFIDDNRQTFQDYKAKVSGKRRPVLGFGNLTAKESIEEILENKDDFYLPLSLIHLFWEFDNSKDRTFVLDSLKFISGFGDDRAFDPVSAYVYAYCLWQSGAESPSQNVLQKLVDQCFPPALATIGDASIANHDIKEGLYRYAHAIDHGHMAITSLHNKIVVKDSHFLKSIPFRIILFFDIFYRAAVFIKKGVKGEHALYLDFYGIKHHLNEYWDIPKADRLQRQIQS